MNFKIFKVNQNDDNYRELIYISYDWEHPPVMRFDPPMTFENEDGFELEATYYNDTDEEINFGLLSTDEMMILFGLFYTGEQLNFDHSNATIPYDYELYPNYPNPFNPFTSIRYVIPEKTNVRITISDLMGRQIRELVNFVHYPGMNKIQWDAKNDKGDPVSSSLYFYTIMAEDFVDTKKMILLK